MSITRKIAEEKWWAERETIRGNRLTDIRKKHEKKRLQEVNTYLTLEREIMGFNMDRRFGKA